MGSLFNKKLPSPLQYFIKPVGEAALVIKNIRFLFWGGLTTHVSGQTISAVILVSSSF